MYDMLKKLVDVCNAQEVQMYWNVDTLSFVKREFKLTEPYWQYDDDDGKYGKYLIYHQGSYFRVKVFNGKLIFHTPSQPSVNYYIEMQHEEGYRISDELYSLELEEDLLNRVDELTGARCEILGDHLTWFLQNNHESIKKSYQRSQIISNILS